MENQQYLKLNSAKAYFFDDYIFFQLGRFIKYQITDKVREIKTDQDDSLEELIDMKLNFSDKVEVYAMFCTQEKHVFQIMAKETQLSLLIIVTWDCIKNCERSMYQISTINGSSPGYYFARGLNKKYNYFIDE